MTPYFVRHWQNCLIALHRYCLKPPRKEGHSSDRIKPYFHPLLSFGDETLDFALIKGSWMKKVRNVSPTSVHFRIDFKREYTSHFVTTILSISCMNGSRGFTILVETPKKWTAQVNLLLALKLRMATVPMRFSSSIKSLWK